MISRSASICWLGLMFLQSMFHPAQAEQQVYDNFEDQRNLYYNGIFENVQLTFPVENPDKSEKNSSDWVGRMMRKDQMWAGIVIARYYNTPDFATDPIFSVKAYVDAESLPNPCGIQMILRKDGEGSTQHSVYGTINKVREWVSINLNFADASAAGKPEFNELWFYISSPDGGEQTIYVDDIAGPPLPEDEDMIGKTIYDNFESERNIHYDGPFENMEITLPFDNPARQGINGSQTCGRLLRKAQEWAGFVVTKWPEIPEFASFDSICTALVYVDAEQLPEPCGIQFILRENGESSTQYSVYKEISETKKWVQLRANMSVAGEPGQPAFNELWYAVSSPDGGEQTILIDDITGPALFDMSYSGIIEASSPAPDQFILYQNYPNPFNPSTTIQFEVPYLSDVELGVYDMMGRKVRTLHSGVGQMGRQNVRWSAVDDQGRRVGSGIYFVRIRSGKMQRTRKIILIE